MAWFGEPRRHREARMKCLSDGMKFSSRDYSEGKPELESVHRTQSYKDLLNSDKGTVNHRGFTIEYRKESNGYIAGIRKKTGIVWKKGKTEEEAIGNVIMMIERENDILDRKTIAMLKRR